MNNKIEKYLCDNKSIEVYRNRLLYNSRKYEHIKDIIKTTKGGKELLVFMNEHKDNLYIFGGGALGKCFIDTWAKIFTFQAVIDNNLDKQGKTIRGIPVISLDAIRKPCGIVIVNKFNSEEIKSQLYTSGFDDSCIFDEGKWHRELYHDLYFDLEQIDKNAIETFVDCGSLDGITCVNMNAWYNGIVNFYWLFEPDKNNIEKCKKNMEPINSKWKIIEKAVWSEDTQLRFNSFGSYDSAVANNGNTLINAICLDNFKWDSIPTFIKMDIEGAEIEALKGSEQLIRNHKPKLAISIYHKHEDITDIPKLILSYNSNYKFYVRHYSHMDVDTVLYAI